MTGSESGRREWIDDDYRDGSDDGGSDESDADDVDDDDVRGGKSGWMMLGGSTLLSIPSGGAASFLLLS